MDRTQVDLPVLEALAGRLRNAGDHLDEIGGRAPGAPDAGEVTALMVAVMAHLTEGAGNLVQGLREAGARVGRAQQAYERQDAATGRDLQGLF